MKKKLAAFTFMLNSSFHFLQQEYWWADYECKFTLENVRSFLQSFAKINLLKCLDLLLRWSALLKTSWITIIFLFHSTTRPLTRACQQSRLWQERCDKKKTGNLKTWGSKGDNAVYVILDKVWSFCNQSTIIKK